MDEGLVQSYFKYFIYFSFLRLVDTVDTVGTGSKQAIFERPISQNLSIKPFVYWDSYKEESIYDAASVLIGETVLISCRLYGFQAGKCISASNL